MMQWACLFSVIYGSFYVSGFEYLNKEIPNGDKVPHPCGNGKLWPGVGHHYPAGAKGTGGIRNRFGIDFREAGLVWTQELCRKDSDMDGRSNGEELGDPNCTWKRGEVPEADAQSHPGICEPTDNAACQSLNERFGDRLVCKEEKPCPALSEPGMKSKDLRFPTSKIPATDTVYTCMVYDLPSDGDYHLTATTPILNNTDIVHHMILFGCDFPDDFNKTLLGYMKAVPYRCGMTPHKHCHNFLGTWTYGHTGDCWSDQAGFRLGRYGTKVAALQVHWNNPRKLADQTDSSGMTIYYTDQRRPNDASMLILGQEHLHIPPMSTDVSFGAKCPSECTREMFKEKIYVTRAVNHMHYYGRKQRISVYRNGTRVKDLTNEDNYDYDHPMFYNYDPPVEVLPGDEIVTKCTYNSDSKKSIGFGAGTSDEMCYGFLTYYPVQHFQQTLCIQWKSVQRCVRKLPKFKGMYRGCDWRSFIEGSKSASIHEAFSNYTCGYYYYHNKCNSNCTNYSQKVLRHPCLQDDLFDWMEMRVRTPLDALRICAKNSADINSPFLVLCVSLIVHLVRYLTVNGN